MIGHSLLSNNANFVEIAFECLYVYDKKHDFEYSNEDIFYQTQFSFQEKVGGTRYLFKKKSILNHLLGEGRGHGKACWLIDHNVLQLFQHRPATLLHHPKSRCQMLINANNVN